ncbi:MAG: glycosyltransferase family 2 protein [Patescibacteria group bacterium]|nr:glycosyltransferase family 2 protein [Patescibacteria group bacterium]
MDKQQKKIKIFCIIPAYNEEKSIIQAINNVKPLVDGIVVVDDGSVDNTAALAARQGVVVLKHLINRGQGAALETGNNYSRDRADVIVHFDADGQFDHREIADIIQPIVDQECDIVFGSRFLGKKSNMPLFKKNIIMPIARLMNYLIIGKSNLTDPQNGFRAMSRKTALLLEINNDGSAHCSEIIQQTIKNKIRYKEIPVTITYSNFGQNIFKGKGRGMGGFQIIKDLLFSKFIN